MNQEQQQKYAMRVQYFVGFIKKHIKKRSWYHDLSRFDPGDNFFERVLRADDKSDKDKQDFYHRILLPAYDILKEKFGEHDAAIESGFTIEQGITNAHEKENHEYTLGYEWWIKIYNLACRENLFNADDKSILEGKRKIFFQHIQEIERQK